VRFAYADPPYLGLAKKIYGDPTYDDPRAHEALVWRLCDDYPDGWAMSLTSGSLCEILAFCPDDVRVMAWVKPFASFKPGVNPAYAWEPVIVRGGRRRGREIPTVRDWIACNSSLGGRSFVGAKPAAFCYWIFDVLGARPDDTLDDLFPGSGAVMNAWKTWGAQQTIFPARTPC